MEILCFRPTVVNILLREYQRIIEQNEKAGNYRHDPLWFFGDFRKYARYGHNLF